MTTSTEELTKLLEAQKGLLMAVATNGPRVKDKADEYAQRSERIRELLDAAGLQDPIPFATLWEWYDQWKDGGLPTFDSRRTYIERMVQPLVDSLVACKEVAAERGAKANLDIFVSHSAKDSQLAGLLSDLLRSALNLAPDRIRCTSVDGYRLEVGANSCERLCEEAQQARALVALLTPSSLSSPFVFFELGARWGAGLFLAPVATGGVSLGELRAPLSGLNVLQLTSRAQVFQLLEDMARQLKRQVVAVASFERDLARVSELAGTD